MAIRQFKSYTVDLVANTEKSWSPPDGCASVEITMDTVADVRMAFTEGDTANDKPYFIFNPDWWTEISKELALSSKHLFYFRCGIDNKLRILASIE